MAYLLYLFSNFMVIVRLEFPETFMHTVSSLNAEVELSTELLKKLLR